MHISAGLRSHEIRVFGMEYIELRIGGRWRQLGLTKIFSKSYIPFDLTNPLYMDQNDWSKLFLHKNKWDNSLIYFAHF